MLLCSRIFASLIAGLALGVVGYAGWSGFLWYFLAHALVIIRHFKPMLTCQRGCRGDVPAVSRVLLDAAYHFMSVVPAHTTLVGVFAIQVGALLRYKAGKDMKPFFQSQ